jgi:hypothetical protein
MTGTEMGATPVGTTLLNYSSLPVSDILESWEGMTSGSTLDAAGTVFEKTGIFLPEPSKVSLDTNPHVFDPHMNMGDFIALIDLSPALQPLQDIVSRGTDVVAASHYWRSFTSVVIAAASRHVISRSVSFLGLLDNPPGLFATTINRTANLFIGLHVDSWYHNPTLRRSKAPNRISINLGQEARTLLFSPVGVVNMIGEGPDIPSHPTELARYYLSRRPTSRIYALKIPPGHAYVAPTENLPHDASTAAMTRLDRTATILGSFHPIANPQQVLCLRP